MPQKCFCSQTWEMLTFFFFSVCNVFANVEESVKPLKFRIVERVLRPTYYNFISEIPFLQRLLINISLCVKIWHWKFGSVNIAAKFFLSYTELKCKEGMPQNKCLICSNFLDSFPGGIYLFSPAKIPLDECQKYWKKWTMKRGFH